MKKRNKILSVVLASFVMFGSIPFFMTNADAAYFTDGTKWERIFLCGASSKDGGRRISSILEDKDKEKYQDMLEMLIEKSEPLWRK